MNHHREGRGEPFVLLHGIGHRWQGWGPVIPRLAACGFEVIAVDSPGFGASPPLPAGVDPTIPAYADAFAAWLSAEGIERPHVAGNSMGGAIALELARRGVVRSAAAVSPAGFWTPGERRFCQASLGLLAGMPRPARPVVRALAGSAAGRAALFAQLFARPWKLPAAEAQETLDAAWAAPAFAPALAAFDRYDFGDPESLRASGVPLTVAWGTRDRLLIYGRQAPRARAALPWARHVDLPGLGHVPSYDDPGMVAAVLRAGTSTRSSSSNGSPSNGVAGTRSA